MLITLAFKKHSKKFSILENLIKIWTNCKYFHVEIIIKDKWISSNSESGGVTIKTLKPLKNNYDYFTLSVDGRKLKKVMQFIENEKNSKYDWCGIFCTQFINLNKQNRNKWFCSEIVSEILKKFEVKEFKDIKPSEMSPADIFKMIKE